MPQVNEFSWIFSSLLILIIFSSIFFLIITYRMISLSLPKNNYLYYYKIF